MANKINKEEVLEISNKGFIIYELIVGPLIDIGGGKYRNVRNPFYNDSKPSMSIYYNDKKGRFVFYDHGNSEYKGDAFDFAAFYFKLDVKKDFSLLLEKIMELLESKKVDLSIHKSIVSATITESKNEFELISRDPENLSRAEKEFMDDYKIDMYIMRDMNVVFIQEFSSNMHTPQGYKYTRRKDDVLLAFKGQNFAKIYRTPEKKFWYVGNKPKNYVFGLDVIEEYMITGDFVIITGGEKDALVLTSLGYNAVSVGSENASLPEKQLNTLRLHFTHIVIMYDLDETGLERSKILSEKHNLLRVVLPNELKELGGKDIADYVKLRLSMEVIDQLIQREISNKTTNNGILPIPVEVECTTANNQNYLPRTAAQRLLDAKNEPPIKMFAGTLIGTSEVVIFFGDTGSGKSIFGVHLADCISSGKDVMVLKNENSPVPVLYYDFEISDKQYEKRYTNEFGQDYEFNVNFRIDSIDLTKIYDPASKMSLDESLLDKISSDVAATGSKLVIIDNITYLKTEASHDSKIALDLMRGLKELNVKLNIAILVIAHTPKRNSSFEFTLNDLAGSKHLSNFADSVFVIGKSSQDSNIRYLKHVKSRNTEVVYHSDNVIVCELVKRDKFLGFEFLEFASESEHLLTNQENEEDLIRKVKTMKDEGKTVRQIAAEIGISKSKVDRLLKK